MQVVLSLEGGYVGEEVADCVVECMSVLLGEGVALNHPVQLTKPPSDQAVADINRTINNHVSMYMS